MIRYNLKMTIRRKSYKQVRDWLYDERKGFCEYCKIKIPKDTATVDHAKPLSLGGYNKRTNYVLSCQPCNSKKGSMTKEQFEKIIRDTKISELLEKQ